MDSWFAAIGNSDGVVKFRDEYYKRNGGHSPTLGLNASLSSRLGTARE